MFNWKAMFIFLMLSVFLPWHANAADKKIENYFSLDSLDISIKSDTYYNTGSENITSETGLVFGFRDFTFDFTPTVTSDDMLTDLKFGFRYDWKLFDDIIIAPYSELHYNDDFSEGDKVIGIKTTIKLF